MPRVPLCGHLRITRALRGQALPSLTLQLYLNIWDHSVHGLKEFDSIVHLGRIRSIKVWFHYFKIRSKLNYLNPHVRLAQTFAEPTLSSIRFPEYSSSIWGLPAPLGTALKLKANKYHLELDPKMIKKSKCGTEAFEGKATYDQEEVLHTEIPSGCAVRKTHQTSPSLCCFALLPAEPDTSFPSLQRWQHLWWVQHNVKTENCSTSISR